MLERALRQAKVPEVMRPLAELCAETSQVPRAVELYLELIQMGQDGGELDQALADLNTVIELSPDDPDLHFEKAQVLSELGSAEDAAAAYSSAAQAYIATKDVARAIDACHRAKNLLPRAPEPHRHLARAYLLDGQTENAVVEYKSLWHALLTGNRPKRALEILREVLDQDCKYPAVKDQVLSHAQNSEAVKTSKAARYLIYVLLVMVLGAGAYLGIAYYQNVYTKDEGKKAVAVVRGEQARLQNALQHGELLDRIAELSRTYGRFDELRGEIGGLEAEVRRDRDERAARLLREAVAFAASGNYDRAAQLFSRVETEFRNAPAAGEVAVERERMNQLRIGADVGVVEASARTRFDALDWDGAVAQLKPLLDRHDLPPEQRRRLVDTLAQWEARTRSAASLLDRAQQIERAGKSEDTVAAYRRVLRGEGEADIARAKARLAVVERQRADEIGTLAQQAARRGDDQQAFLLVDQLFALQAAAVGREVADYLASLELPFQISVDAAGTRLSVVRIAGGRRSAAQVVAAPAGTRGGWQHTLGYRLGEVVEVTAERVGFAPQVLTASVKGRRVQAAIALARGARWSKPLGSGATARPLVVGGQLVYPTERATVEIVDPREGISSPIEVRDSVSTFRVPPAVLRNRGYVVLEDRVRCLDLAARVESWAWSQRGVRLNGQIAVADHAVKLGSALIAAGSADATGGLVLLEADESGRVVVLPPLGLDGAVAAEPLFIRTPRNGRHLLVMAGRQIALFDVTTLSERVPARRLVVETARTDLVGWAVPARIGAQDVHLVCESAGLLLALALDPALPEPRRNLGSWPLGGTPAGGAALDAPRQRAYVAVEEGRVVAVDLDRPGQLAWKFPNQGAIGALVGAPALGARGLYVADGAGLLRCLDPATGVERWRADLGGPVAGGVLVHEGRVYAPTRGGVLHCFEEGDE
jgi:tetratricopeptide (TPR) repeat protein